jgi:hypothetical protein
MKKISIGIAIVLLFSSTPLYSQNEESTQSRRDERKEQRQERKEERQNSRDEKRQERAARRATASETTELEKVIIESTNEADNKEVETPKDTSTETISETEKIDIETPKATSTQRHESTSNVQQTEIVPALKLENVDAEESVKIESKNTYEDSDNNNSTWWIVGILLVGGYLLVKGNSSKKCKACGKSGAMREFHTEHLGATKKEYVKEVDGRGHYVYTNKYEIHRRCRHCGYEDCVITTTKG